MKGLKVDFRTNSKGSGDVEKNTIGQKESEFEHQKDISIWQEFKKGNENAFNFIYDTYFPILYNYGCQFTNDKEVVKDHIQDLFVDLKIKRSKLGDTTSIKFYLFKSLKRKIVRALGKTRHVIYDKNVSENYDFEIALSHESYLIHSQLDIEMKEKLEEVLKKLTKRQKEAILYYYHEGLTYEEIASLMNFSRVEYARILISRAKVKLRKELHSLKNVFLLVIPIISSLFSR